MADPADTIDAYDFDLPPELIALRPASPRDSARLLIVDPLRVEPFEDRLVSDLPGLLRPGDMLVFNDTKVLPAQLFGLREPRPGTSAEPVQVGLTLLEPMGDGAWRAFARPARRLAPADRILLEKEGAIARLIVTGKLEGEVTLRPEDGSKPMEAVMLEFGLPPLPPYIASRRPADARDRNDYQTVYAAREGAVAAPTAGLHFTPELLARLEESGVKRAFLTLHVGAGTFLPVKTERLSEHRMHAEWGEITPATADAINAARSAGGRIIAVGTTALRLLESAAGADGRIAPFSGKTDIFIKPGDPIRSSDLLFTNFHLPKSTLFMLVCAFSGTDIMQRAYAHAIRGRYRFYSYGDACLLHRAQAADKAHD